MNSSVNNSICELMAENGNMKALLVSLLPDLQEHVHYLGAIQNLWPARETLATLHCNETHIRKIKVFTNGFLGDFNG
jgi:hypothetical protein